MDNPTDIRDIWFNIPGVNAGRTRIMTPSSSLHTNLDQFCQKVLDQHVSLQVHEN